MVIRQKKCYNHNRYYIYRFIVQLVDKTAAFLYNKHRLKHLFTDRRYNYVKRI